MILLIRKTVKSVVFHPLISLIIELYSCDQYMNYKAYLTKLEVENDDIWRHFEPN